MASPYAEQLPQIIKDIHDRLVSELNLSTPFKSSDPQIGEAYGLLSAQNINESRSGVSVNCLFLASSGFATYWEAASWSAMTGMNLDHALLLLQRAIAHRGIVGEFNKTGSITVGRPRSPLKAIAGQQANIWIVDVLMPCSLELVFSRDLFSGHA